MNVIQPQKLQCGDTIGIIAPSIALKPEHIQHSTQRLCSLGFHIQLADHIFSDAYGFSGSIEERAEDFNAMISNDKIKMLLFGGGEVCNEILPYIDYDNIRRNPKIICSSSDSTTLLNAINYMSGLITFYGASVRTFEHLTDYNRQAFENLLMTAGHKYMKSAPWKTIHPGKCEGAVLRVEECCYKRTLMCVIDIRPESHFRHSPDQQLIILCVASVSRLNAALFLQLFHCLCKCKNCVSRRGKPPFTIHFHSLPLVIQIK